MPKRGSIETAAGKCLIQEFLRKNEFDAEFLQIMLGVFMRVCHTLEVRDASDPLTKTVVRTVINIASEGVRDTDILYERTLSRLRSNN